MATCICFCATHRVLLSLYTGPQDPIYTSAVPTCFSGKSQLHWSGAGEKEELFVVILCKAALEMSWTAALLFLSLFFQLNQGGGFQVSIVLVSLHISYMHKLDWYAIVC